MSKKEFFPPRPSTNPTIYAYELVGVDTHSGNLIRHIDVKTQSDYRNPKVETLIKEAINFAIQDMDKPTKSIGKTISKIRTP